MAKRKQPVWQLEDGTMETDAWKSLGGAALRLYLCLRAMNPDNKGTISVGCQEAGEMIGVTSAGANLAFHVLQARGFIVQSSVGNRRAGPSAYELSEGYRRWKKGSDFHVVKDPKKVEGHAKAQLYLRFPRQPAGADT